VETHALSNQILDRLNRNVMKETMEAKRVRQWSDGGWN